MKQRQYIIGHCGAGGEVPENTLQAFRVGCESSAVAVECDVQLTADKQLIVIHDETVDRTTNGRGLVRDLNLNDIRKLKVNGGGSLPILAEVIGVVRQYNKMLMIEVKAKTTEEARETCAATIAWIFEHHAAADAEIHSFFSEAVQMASVAGLRAAFIIDALDDVTQVITTTKHIGAYSINAHHAGITQELIKQSRDQGLEIGAWTVDTTEDFLRMKTLGVTGLITNYPNRFTLS